MKSGEKVTFIGPLPQLFVAGRLLHEVQDGFSHVGIGQWVGLGVHFSFSLPTNNQRKKKDRSDNNKL